MSVLIFIYITGVLAAFGSCLTFRSMSWPETIKLSACSWVSFGFLVCDKIVDLENRIENRNREGT